MMISNNNMVRAGQTSPQHHPTYWHYHYHVLQHFPHQDKQQLVVSLLAVHSHQWLASIWANLGECWFKVHWLHPSTRRDRITRTISPHSM